MNKTRKLTNGAMFLAIVGAVMLIDRQLSFAFTELVVMAFAVVVVLYGAMYSFKDSIYLSLCLLVLIVLFGGTYSYVYGPISILVGMAYCFGLNKDLDTGKLMLVAMITYILGELIYLFFIAPIFLNFTISDNIVLLKESMDATKQIFTESGLALNGIVNNLFDSSSFLLTMVVLSSIIIGAMEGMIIHLLSIILLKRFKIKDLKVRKLYDIKNNVVLAYISMALVMLSFIAPYFKNEMFLEIATVLSLCGGLVLIYYGYIFVMSYVAIVLKGRHPFLVMLGIIFLFPLSIFILIILGFLYGSGPLFNYLQNKRLNNEKGKL